MKDNLNAEVVLGTVTNVKEACAWLGYTYLSIRMKLNPLAYGIGWEEVRYSLHLCFLSSSSVHGDLCDFVYAIVVLNHIIILIYICT